MIGDDRGFPEGPPVLHLLLFQNLEPRAWTSVAGTLDAVVEYAPEVLRDDVREVVDDALLGGLAAASFPEAALVELLELVQDAGPMPL